MGAYFAHLPFYARTPEKLMLHLLAYLVQRDVSLEQLSQLTGTDLKHVAQKTTERPTLKQLEDLWRNAVHLTGDPLLGLHFGESLQLAALGAVGQLIQTSRTIGEALTQAAAFTGLVTDLLTLHICPFLWNFYDPFCPATGRAADFPFRLPPDDGFVYGFYPARSRWTGSRKN